MICSSGCGYTFDDNGNLLATGVMTNAWDAANRLIEANRNEYTLTPLYNGLGDRVGQTVGVTTTHFALDVQGLPEVIYISDGNAFLHLPGVIVAESSTGETHYLLSDGLGSVRQATDETATVVTYQEFDPYGNPVDNIGGEPYGYTGEWFESYIHLLFLRARWYAPETGTFLSVDPVESEPPYQYVGGNVVNLTDPSGMLTICFQGAPGSEEVDMKDEELALLHEMCKALQFPGKGSFKPFNNRWIDVHRAHSLALRPRDTDDEPLTVIGYSYGGAAALELAWLLDYPPLHDCQTYHTVDNLVLIDVETLARPALRLQFTRLEIPGNVKRSLNLYASTGRFYGEHGPSFTPQTRGIYVMTSQQQIQTGYWAIGVYLDGVDHFPKATNNWEVIGSDHSTIVDKGFGTPSSYRNPNTFAYIQYFLNGGGN